MELAPGLTLSHYRIMEKIGEGGMGVVYRALDLRLEREVAVKVLPAGVLADEPARTRFRQEALTLSQVNHPHLAVVHDFDSKGGVDFLVMELLQGETLAARVERGPLPPEVMLRHAVEIAEGGSQAGLPAPVTARRKGRESYGRGSLQRSLRCSVSRWPRCTGCVRCPRPGRSAARCSRRRGKASTSHAAAAARSPSHRTAAR